MAVPSEISSYFDDDGRLANWPAKKRRAQRDAILRHLAEVFEPGRQYSERDVNEVLKSQMTYADHVLIRRELFDAKLLDRTPDGSAYWRVALAFEKIPC